VSPQWSLSLRFPHQNPVHTSPLHHTRHMPPPISFFSIFPPAQYWVRSTPVYIYKFSSHLQENKSRIQYKGQSMNAV
jgi:hypothetical protein